MVSAKLASGLCACVAVAFIAAVVSAPTPVSAEADGSAPVRVGVAPEFADIGEVRPNAQVATQFVLTNEGDRPVEVADITKSCSCVEAAVDPMRIEPGAQAIASVKVNVRVPRGAVSDAVMLTCRDATTGAATQVTLSIRGTVKPFVEVSESQLLFSDGQPAVHTVEFSAPAQPNFAILGAAANDDSVSATVESGRRLRVVFAPKPGHMYSGGVVVAVATNSPEEPEVRLPVYVRPASPGGERRAE